MNKYFIQLSFNGESYHGWQRQPNAVTVQQMVEDAFSILLKYPVEVVGAGRTDAGVHARYFIAHVELNNLIDIQSLIYHLNCILPVDIAIQNIFPVHENAHARFDAVSRTYHYYIVQKKDPFSIGKAWYLPDKLDIGKMNEGASIIRESTDFTSFSKVHTDTFTNTCKVMYAKWEIQDNHFLIFKIQADRFLRNMVRAIVGTLLDVGRGKISVEGLRGIIESKNRCNAGFSVPAEGLWLEDIQYPYLFEK